MTKLQGIIGNQKILANQILECLSDGHKIKKNSLYKLMDCFVRNCNDFNIVLDYLLNKDLIKISRLDTDSRYVIHVIQIKK